MAFCLSMILFFELAYDFKEVALVDFKVSDIDRFFERLWFVRDEFLIANLKEDHSPLVCFLITLSHEPSSVLR